MSNPPTQPRPKPFEGVDLGEAGRKGGIASGRSRRLRELEDKVRRGGNAQAAYQLSRLKRQDAADLLRERRQADEMVERTRLLAEQQWQRFNELRNQVSVRSDR